MSGTNNMSIISKITYRRLNMIIYHVISSPSLFLLSHRFSDKAQHCCLLKSTELSIAIQDATEYSLKNMFKQDGKFNVSRLAEDIPPLRIHSVVECRFQAFVRSKLHWIKTPTMTLYKMLSSSCMAFSIVSRRNPFQFIIFSFPKAFGHNCATGQQSIRNNPT
ncbi:uncharacterized protein ACHE_51291A [Aspergillus chevalieri]|uniref:Uncharacterized protein n=1 Tax=Aspergillus chevalieri TaxID=182096 RepID=A0A7R7ZPY3_ASPCH|nr:uncharacterized protein ACHE_51291A [Aspergillus chevalieri]BCR90093.1 hypothetical protein ACHE_51291A [Aspergillus chevalieri]